VKLNNRDLGGGNLEIFADRRWPIDTGIGKVQLELESRLPDRMRIVDLEVRGRIGSPLSPLAITRALRGANSRGVYFSAGFVPPLASKIPSVVIVHDLTHRRFYGAAKRAYYDHIYKPLYRRCDAIICVSEFTRQEFLDWSGMPADQVHMVYNGVETMFSEGGPSYDPGHPYILYCGNHRPYKNLVRLIGAYASSSLPKNGIRLVLSGENNAELSELASKLRIGDFVVFAGRIPAVDIPAYYRGALAVAYVSLFEGFGLPIVEAFNCGVPVITSNVSAMPEVAAGGALIVDPRSVEEIRSALDRVTGDLNLRKRLIEAGRQRRADFDWNKSAARIWEIVGNVAD